jgi:hypothetical protein
MNQVTDKIQTGSLGEMLVQIRLLQFGIQAAAPLKDSGNDLIAVNGREFRAISIRTTTSDRYKKPKIGRMYHVLVVVRLVGNGREVLLDKSELFLLPQPQVAAAPNNCLELSEYKFSATQVERLFGELRL